MTGTHKNNAGKEAPLRSIFGPTISRILVALFALTLWAPMAGMLFGWNIETDVIERRTRALFPVWGEHPVEEFPSRFISYFNDRLAFRDAMIYGHSFARIKLFGTSTSDRVLIGKQQWLFYTGSEQIEDHQGLTLPSDTDLAHWRDVLEGKQAWLAERGIRYLFVLVPNKVTIYPEYLPAGIRRRQEMTRADLLVAFLREYSTVEIVDLRPVLRAASQERLVYYPYGTHWNHHGAFFGYQEVAKRLANWHPGKQPFQLEDFEPHDIVGEDICHMMGLRAQDWPSHYAEYLSLKHRQSENVPATVPPICQVSGVRQPVAIENKKADNTLLVVHDSFFAGFMQVALAEQYRRSLWVRFNLELSHERLLSLIEQESPDIVVEERIERFMRLPPERHPEYDKARARLHDRKVFH
jgi:alginate O-acetyltransferase complex protein AlgJ